jgi:hypothetical protein
VLFTTAYIDDHNGADNGCIDLNLEIDEGHDIGIEVCLRNGASGAPQWCSQTVWTTS